ncbi:MAG: preprotein translocase subunit SecG [Pseudomonadota bacterium]
MLNSIIIFVHLFLAAAIIGLILLQQGKGADAGAAFGAGASGTVFGAKGSASFLSRTTAILATAFFGTSLTLAYFQGDRSQPTGIMERLSETPELGESLVPPVDDVQSTLPELPSELPGTEAPASAPSSDAGDDEG